MAKDKKKVKEKAAKSQQNGVEKPAASGNSAIWQDERFQHLVTDPRFKNLPKVQRKVKIDKRFEGMFTNDKFQVKYTVDKYGRRVNRSNADDLRKYYELNSSDDEEKEEEEEDKVGGQESEKDDSEEDEQEEREKEEKAIIQESDVDENDALTSDDEEMPKSLRDRLLDPNIDYARGEGRLITDSSSDDDSSEDDEDPEMYIDHVWGELDNDADTTDESTRRLAVCNMDWDRVRAVDLMVLFNSFLPRGGSILSIKIYPSEFGKERMKEEELHGPPELVGLDKDSRNPKKESDKPKKKKKTSGSDDEDDELVVEQDSDAEEGDEYHMEKLRQYQLNRLRYYYAVMEFDSVESADKIYKECDGIEYESSATKIDLRYIPDDTTFDEDEPTDVCLEMPDMNTYQPRQFTTTALQQAKVDLTWDETAVDRKELGDKLSSGKMDGISDQDLRKIVAYSSEEEEEEEEGDGEADEEEEDDAEESQVEEEKPVEKKSKKPKSKKKEEVINKYKALLAEINEKEQKEKEKKKYAMEFTWEVNEGNENKEDDKDKEETFEGKPKSELTPIEKVLLKRSEKNKRRKEERKKKKLQAAGVESESDLDSLPEGIDMSDPYFAEEFANGDFVDPKAKRKEKQKKQRQLKAEQEEEDEKNAKELELLLDDNEEDHKKQHFSLEKILKQEQETKSKKKRKKQLKKSKADIEESNKPIEDNFQLNVNDNRFKAVFTSHEFNIDPTDPHFKKTKGMEQLIHEKLKRRHNEGDVNKTANGNAENDGPDSAKKPKKNIENILLVKNLKRKIQMKQQQQQQQVR
ncbi:ESF1 homolog [Musca domestica]|uniref:ESF1 homolog n=1 Tax=Musca domestica TaxID=7370 RepID=A0A9J7CI18_MUSDO|nr:ESF1 homolog [Musca domestica]